MLGVCVCVCISVYKCCLLLNSCPAGQMHRRINRKERERKRLRGSDEVFLCGGQVADCWSWEMKAGEDQWSTPQNTAAGDGSLPSLLFSRSVPESGWCIRVRRGGVSGGSERTTPTRRGPRRMRRSGGGGGDEEEEENKSGENNSIYWYF